MKVIELLRVLNIFDVIKRKTRIVKLSTILINASII